MSLTGYSAEEILGQTMRVLKSGKQGEDFYRELWQTILAGRGMAGRTVNRSQGRDPLHRRHDHNPGARCQRHGHPFRGHQAGRHRTQAGGRALEERTVYLNTLFEISPMGIVVLDTEGRIQMSNSAFEKLFRFSRQEILGAKLDDFIVPPELAWKRRA